MVQFFFFFVKMHGIWHRPMLSVLASVCVCVYNFFFFNIIPGEQQNGFLFWHFESHQC